MLNLRKKIKKLDALDLAIVKTACIIFGFILAVYLTSLRGFVEQNIIIVLFFLVVIGVRPIIRFWK